MTKRQLWLNLFHTNDVALATAVTLCEEYAATGKQLDTVFDNIVIKNTVKKEDLVPFDILVYEESVQSEGFSSPEEAFARL